MKADVWLWIGAAVVVWLAIIGWAIDRYLCAVWWWPLVGTEWRAERRKYYLPAWTGPDDPQSPVPVPDDDDWGSGPLVARPAKDDDDEWADQLHVINLDAHRDRPIAQLTHYEVEAVIRDLGVPQWVPQRYRTAA